jgi:multiple sugar transport system permease protein
MAGALIAALPMLVVFFLLQRQIIEGIALTGMKG